MIKQFFIRRWCFFLILLGTGYLYWQQIAPPFHAVRFIAREQFCPTLEILDAAQFLTRVVEKLQLTVSAQPRYFPLIGTFISHWRAANYDLAAPFFGMKRYAWGGEKITVGRLEHTDQSRVSNFLLIAGADNSYQLFSAQNQSLGTGTIGIPFDANSAAGHLMLLITNLNARPGTEFIVTYTPAPIIAAELRPRIKISHPNSGIIALELDDPNQKLATLILQELADQYLRLLNQCIQNRNKQVLDLMMQTVTELKTALDQSTLKLDNFRREHGELDRHEEESLYTRINQLNHKVSQFREKAARVLERFGSEHPAYNLLNDRTAQLSAEIETLQKRLPEFPLLRQQKDHLMQELSIATNRYLNQLNQIQERKNQHSLLIMDQFPQDPSAPGN